MKPWHGMAIATLVAALAGFFLAQQLLGDRVPLADVARELAARDSSVALVLRQRDLRRELGTTLARRVDSMRANPEVVTRIEIRRDTLRLTDTLEVTDTLRIVEQQGDTAVVDLEPFTEAGITVLERITVAPWPLRFFSRELEVGFDPDTLALAFVRDELGIGRIITASEREGIDLRTVFAAELDQGPGGLQTVFEWARPIGCAVAGYALAKEQYYVAGGGASVCVAGFVIPH